MYGTLHYVTDYTGFSGDPDLQEGNYLALKVSDVPEGATMTAELVGGHSGPVTLDSDLDVVFRIENTANQTVKFVATKDGDTATKYFGLTHVICEDE